MRHFSQSFVAILAALMAFPAAASPPDALVNNTPTYNPLHLQQ